MSNCLIRRGLLQSPAPLRSGSRAIVRRGLWYQSPLPRALSHGVMRRGCLVQSKCSGRGYFAGTLGGTGIVTVNGKPARRKIYVIDMATMQFVRSTWSNDDGTYWIGHLDETRKYLLIALDNYNSRYRPQAWDKLSPKLMIMT